MNYAIATARRLDMFTILINQANKQL